LKRCLRNVLDVRTSAHLSVRLGPRSLCLQIFQEGRIRQTVKLTLSSSRTGFTRVAREPICTIRSVERTKPPAYLFSNHQCQRARDKIEPTALSLSARPASSVSVFLPPAPPRSLRPVWRPVSASAPPVRGYLRFGAGGRKGFFAERWHFLRAPRQT
jgi:hypothetical protein